MSLLLSPVDADARIGRPLVSERHLRSALAAVSPSDGLAPRALVVGNAGSGKTALLRRLHRHLTDDDQRVTVLSGRESRSPKIPRAEVLIVDDLHLMAPELVDQIGHRAADQDAALVVASRPWPRSRALSGIATLLESTHPAIVLGHVSRSDLLTHLDQTPIADTCVEHILTVTGGVSWLVAEALQAHDERDCAGDPGHRELGRMLGELIAHRLGLLDDPVRRTVEARCLTSGLHARALAEAGDDDESALRGYAEGLLLRTGRPVPIVRSAVRALIPPRTAAKLSIDLSAGLVRAAAGGDTDMREWLTYVQDATIADALMGEGDRLLDDDPAQAGQLYEAATACGGSAEQLRPRRARAAFAAGELDEAARVADESPAEPALADVAAAVWAARGQMGHALAEYTALDEPATGDGAAIAAFALGDATALDASAAATTPTTLRVAMDLLRRGLRDSATDASGAGVAELERAAELYSSAGATAPIPELPAVIAASAAVVTGDLDVAHAVLDDALDADHGGAWAQPRLLLWRAWVAVLRARPLDARAALDEAVRAGGNRLMPRDAFLADAVRIAIARRYEDDAALDAAWARARRSIMRVEVDMFLLSPFAELVSSAAKLGQSEAMRAPLAAAVALVDRLGSPVWAAHVHWAGIQQGILLSRPAELTPYARALVAAGRECRVAAAMARAGRVWTSVLGGTVDPDAVESAADGLAEVGLAWDGARLAGHGASRTDDRRIAARLLARARELHPTDAGRRPAADQTATAADELLSERELEVARLVVQGRTYAEIGATIFISPRTAEHHIAHIRRRLGATSRSDLIARLRALLAEETDARGAGEASPVLTPTGIGVPPDAGGPTIS